MKKHTILRNQLKGVSRGVAAFALLAAPMGVALAQGKKAAPARAPAAAPAPAASPAPTGAPQGDVSYKQKTVYDFEDDMVTGALVTPDGERVDSRGTTSMSSLIKIRPSFVREMIKSAEDR